MSIHLTSFKFKLNDNLGGGGTVFPLLGVGVRPRKGSVLFWYSLSHDGRRDGLSLHGGCPVVHGVKWGKIITKFA